MKKILAMILALCMVFAMAATCAYAEDSVELYIYQDKYEIDEALKAACDAYTALHPNVTFVVESSSSGEFATQLKTMFAGGQGPDIFSTKGSDDLAVMVDYMEDLSGEAWVEFMSDAALEGGSNDGKVYGFPIAEESYGYVYSKEAFEAAGIEKVPTTLSELRDACDKLVAAGYEKPISANYMEWYQSGMFKFSAIVSRQADPMAFIAGMNDGSETFIGNAEVANLAAWMDIEKEYGNSILNTDFNTQVSTFTDGTCALMLGGSWSQSAIDDANPGMAVGLFPLPLSENAEENNLYTSSAPYWSVNNESANKEAAKDFLNWLAMTEEGQSYLGAAFKLIPAFTHFAADQEAIGPLGTDTKTYMDNGQTVGIYSSFFPEGGAQLFGEAVNMYAADVLDAEGFAEQLQASWESVR